MLNFIKKVFHINEKKEWLDALFKNIESAWSQGRYMHFRIIDVKDKGFLVKVGGMFAFLPFQSMPWHNKGKGTGKLYWQVISSSLVGKIFYCKIVKAEKVRIASKPGFSILIDASIHIFRPVELSPDIPYSGIIIHKSRYGVFVEIGSHFNWYHGSIVGLLHKSRFTDKESFEVCEVGQTLPVYYHDRTKKGIYFTYSEVDWYSDKIEAYVVLDPYDWV